MKEEKCYQNKGMEGGRCNEDKSDANEPFSLVQVYRINVINLAKNHRRFSYTAYQITMPSYPFLLTLHVTYKEYQHYHIYRQHLPKCANEQGKKTCNYERNEMQLL
jgi:hypothetical protein